MPRPGSPRRLLLAFVATALASAAFVAAPAPANAVPDCTITGTAKADRLVGTPGRDVICGGRGADVIDGRGGNDYLIGGAGDDRLAGGAGNDHVNGGGGADSLVGGDGKDELRGSTGNDTLRGGLGSDVLRGEDGADSSYGEAGDDTVYGDAGRDRLSGGPGRDLATYRITNVPVRLDLDGVADDGARGEGDLIVADFEMLGGSNRSDTLTGGPGADTLIGYNSPDKLIGGGGDDTLLGEEDRDELHGGDGDDVLRGGTGNDLLEGGPGSDTLDGAQSDAPGWNVCDKDTADVSVTSCRKDSAAPVVESVSAGGSVHRPGATFTARMALSDTAGVARAGVTVTLDGVEVAMCSAFTGSTEAPGDSWTATCTVPAAAEPGGYLVTPWAVDRLGQTTPTVPVRDASFAVLGDEPDSSPPQVTAVSVSESTLTPGQSFTILADLNDVSGVAAAYADIRPGLGLQWCDDGLSGRRVVGTTVTEGTWRMTCQVPATASPGTYTFSAWGRDTAENEDPTADRPTGSFEVASGP